MSERSVYLREQADKYQWQARRIMDDETQAQLLKMAAEYIKRAVEIEGAKIESREWSASVRGKQTKFLPIFFLAWRLLA
jgi:hypothetical protein